MKGKTIPISKVYHNTIELFETHKNCETNCCWGIKFTTLSLRFRKLDTEFPVKFKEDTILSAHKTFNETAEAGKALSTTEI